MQGFAIELGVHGDGADAQLAGSAYDTHGDLAAVGDEDLLQHGCQCTCLGASTTPGRRRVAAGLDVEHVAATGSTNDDLVAAATGVDRSVLVADYQHAGRGRLDRVGGDAGSNLLASILFHHGADARRAGPGE